MFVRWKKRQLSTDAGTLESTNVSLYAVLVQNNRVQGKTRQRVVKYLGYINEAALSDPNHQSRFWQQVRKNLETLKLEPEEHLKIITKLIAVVPDPLYLTYLAIPGVIAATSLTLAV